MSARAAIGAAGPAYGFIVTRFRPPGFPTFEAAAAERARLASRARRPDFFIVPEIRFDGLAPALDFLVVHYRYRLARSLAEARNFRDRARLSSPPADPRPPVIRCVINCAGAPTPEQVAGAIVFLHAERNAEIVGGVSSSAEAPAAGPRGDPS